MKTNDVSKLLRCVTEQKKSLSSLAPSLREDLADTLSRLAECTRDLEAISRLLDQFPDQPVPGTVQSVLDLLSKDRCSMPRLVQRIKAARQNGEDKDSLRGDLSSLPVPDLKALVKNLGSKADNKQTALETLEMYLRGEPLPDPDAEKVESTHKKFMDIYDDISELSIEAIRSRFQPIARQPKNILEKLAESLGRQFRGSKKELSDQLLGILEGKKGSQVQTELIGSP